jgi:hypothetical protein
MEKDHTAYWKTVSQGICKDCKKAPALEGKRRCADCAEKMRQDSAARYARMKAKDICTYCRHRKAMPHRELCFGCFQKKARLDRYRREQKKAATHA